MMRRNSLIACIALYALSGCNTVERVSSIGKTPKFSKIEPGELEGREHSLVYQDMRAGLPQHPLHTLQPERPNDTSLFRASAKALFRDQRAQRAGDILTVKINIADSAQVDNTTTRTRNNTESAQAPALLGLEAAAAASALKLDNLTDVTSQSRSTGNGQIQRKDTISLTVAAVVTNVLPNGNLIIKGHQEVRVNFEVRELVIAGIVRPEDITRDNTIDHTQIAEARIAYGGRGQLTDVQQARYGQQLFDAIFPF